MLTWWGVDASKSRTMPEISFELCNVRCSRAAFLLCAIIHSKRNEKTHSSALLIMNMERFYIKRILCLRVYALKPHGWLLPFQYHALSEGSPPDPSLLCSRLIIAITRLWVAVVIKLPLQHPHSHTWLICLFATYQHIHSRGNPIPNRATSEIPPINSHVEVKTISLPQKHQSISDK